MVEKTAQNVQAAAGSLEGLLCDSLYSYCDVCTMAVNGETPCHSTSSNLFWLWLPQNCYATACWILHRAQTFAPELPIYNKNCWNLM